MGDYIDVLRNAIRNALSSPEAGKGPLMSLGFSADQLSDNAVTKEALVKERVQPLRNVASEFATFPAWPIAVAGVISPEARELYGDIQRKSDEFFGAKPPETWQDQAVRSLAYMLPSKAIVGAISALPKIPRIAAGLMLPMSQFQSIPGKVAEYTVPLLASEGLGKLTDTHPTVYKEEENAPYKGLFGDVNVSEPVQQQQTLPAQKFWTLDDSNKTQVSNELPVDAFTKYFGPAVIPQTKTQQLEQRAPESDKSRETEDAFTRLFGPVKPENDDMSGWWKTLIGAGAVTGALAAYAFGRKSILASSVASPSVPPRAATLTSNLLGSTFDQMAPLTVPMAQAAKGEKRLEDAVETLSAALHTRGVNQNLAVIVSHIADTGEFPRVGRTVNKLSPHMTALSKLNADELRLYDEGMRAGTLLDYAKQENVNGVIRGYTPADMVRIQREYDAARANPLVSKLMDNIHEWYRQLVQVLGDEHFLSSKQVAEFLAVNPRYSTISLAELDPELVSWSANLLDPRRWKHLPKQAYEKLVSATTIHPRTRRPVGALATQFFHREGNPPPIDDIVRASLMHEPYLATVVAKIEANRLRRTTVALARQMPIAKQWIGREQKAEGINTIPIVKRGVVHHVQILDDGMRTVLQFEPLMSVPYLNAMRRIVTEFSTGLANPAFLPTGLMYEVPAAIANRPTGTGLGLLDELSKKLGFHKSLSDILSVDPTVVLLPLTGTARGVGANIAKAMARNLEASLLTERGAILGMLGPDKTKALARFMLEHYKNSAQGFMHETGVTSTVLLHNRMADDMSSLLSDISPEFMRRAALSGWDRFKANGVLRSYAAFMHAAYNSMRHEYSAANLPRNWRSTMSFAEKTRLAHKATELTLNPTQSGRHWVTRSAVTSIPYANVFLQALHRAGRSMKDHPTRYLSQNTAALALGLAYVAKMSASSEEARRKYWEEKTPAERAQFVPLFDPENGEVMHEWKLGQGFRLFWSPLIEAFGLLFGYTYDPTISPEQQVDRRTMWEQVAGVVSAEPFKRGLAAAFLDQFLPDPVPPGIGAPLAAMNVDPNTVNPLRQLGSGKFDVKSYYANRIDTIHESTVAGSDINTRIQGVISELLGASARPVLDAAFAFESMRGNGEDFMKSLSVASKHFMTAKAQSLPTSTTMWGVEDKVSSDRAELRLVRDADATLKKAGEIFTRTMYAPGMTGKTVKSTQLEMYKPEEQSPAVRYIASQLVTLGKDPLITAGRSKLRSLYANREALRTSPIVMRDPNDYTRRVNEYNKEIDVTNQSLGRKYLEIEDQINVGLREQLGIRQRFSIRELNPDDWR